MGVRLDEHSMDCWMIYSRDDTSRYDAVQNDLTSRDDADGTRSRTLARRRHER